MVSGENQISDTLPNIDQNFRTIQFDFIFKRHTVTRVFPDEPLDRATRTFVSEFRYLVSGVFMINWSNPEFMKSIQ